jgi:hypothetical protein
VLNFLVWRVTCYDCLFFLVFFITLAPLWNPFCWRFLYLVFCLTPRRTLLDGILFKLPSRLLIIFFLSNCVFNYLFSFWHHLVGRRRSLSLISLFTIVFIPLLPFYLMCLFLDNPVSPREHFKPNSKIWRDKSGHRQPVMVKGRRRRARNKLILKVTPLAAMLPLYLNSLSGELNLV